MRMIFSLLVLFSTCFAHEQTICLNMIVKDEEKVIERCLNSVKPLIDYWVIVDTGSSDATKKLIKRCMKGIPGRLYSKPWVNFEHNRNEALALARGKGDYVLVIDADEELSYEEDFVLPKLDKDYYFIQSNYGGLHYQRSQLVKNEECWKWAGVLHEVIISDELKVAGQLTGFSNIVRHEGCRSQNPKKFDDDVAVLKEAIAKEPENARYRFYLAQTLRDGGRLEEALEAYEKRIALGGWDQEVFWSKYQRACLSELLEKPSDEVIRLYSEAYAYRPSRAEPLYCLASYLRRQGNYLLGYAVASQALTIPKSDDVLFVEDWVFQHGLLIEKSASAYWIGKYEECLTLSNQIFKDESNPPHVRECAEKNMEWAVKQIALKAIKTVYPETEIID